MSSSYSQDDTGRISTPDIIEHVSGPPSESEPSKYISNDGGIPQEVEAKPTRVARLQSAPHILFYACFSTQSSLVEQSLKERGCHITIVQDIDSLQEEWRMGIYDLMMLDHAVGLNEKLHLLKASQEQHNPTPIIMIFEPETEHESELALSSGANACVIRDSYGEYLLKIPQLVDTIARKSDLRATQEARIDISKFQENDTDRIDLKSLAAEVSGMTGSPKNAGIIVIGGPDVGKSVELDSTLCVVGRDSSCQLHLRDESISRFHASLKTLADGTVVLRDLDSTNGTYVDGHRIKQANLKEGSRILLGQSTYIRYQLQDSIDSKFCDELYYSSTRDGLTGLFNRRSCIDMMKTNMAYSKRHQRPASVLMIDIDHFKRINDMYGHQVGDIVLSSVATNIDSQTRSEDVLGRYGGEEFIIFALDTNVTGAMVLAERIRKTVEREVIKTRSPEPQKIDVTVSIGLATASPGDDYELDTLISLADANLYKAKNSSRNCVVGPNTTPNSTVLGQLKR